LEQENQDLEKKLSEKDEENSRLKNLNQRLLEQIKKLKNEKLENPDVKNKVDKVENEELLRLRNHNQNLLTQIKKLKNNKKSLENKLEQIIKKEASKSSDVKIQVVEKGTNTDPVISQLKKIPIHLEKRHIRMLEYKRWKLQVYLLIEMQLSTNQCMKKIKHQK
jgi:hypothetical protein